MKRVTDSFFRLLLPVSACSMALSFGFITGCQTANKTSKAIRLTHPNGGVVVPSAPTLEVQTGVAKPLTSLGYNSQARFSPDGKRLVFASRDRATHRQAQVYELNLATMIERRVTFHDGDDSGVLYTLNGEQIIYASTTDEIKEEPVVLSQLMKTYLPASKSSATQNAEPFRQEPTEIYIQRLSDGDLERLTANSGFDGEPTLGPKGQIVFSSWRDGSLNLHSLNGNTLTRLSRGSFLDSSPALSPTGRALVWARRSSAREPDQLMITEDDFKTIAPLLGNTYESATDLQPAWHPSGDAIVFTSNRGKNGFFNLFVLDRKSSCLKRLTEVAGDQLYPAFSADGKSLAFTLRQGAESQIYMMDYKLKGACLVAASSVVSSVIPQ